ncbi:hypothetical protein ACJMK2_036796, partial [Sinanodonta woodiana]
GVMQIPAQTMGFAQQVVYATVVLDMRGLRIVTLVAFVEPTFADGSTITCYNGERCEFSVFVAGGSNPAVDVQYISDGLESLLNVSKPVKVQYVLGIQNMFDSLVSIEAFPGKSYLGHQYICLEAHASHTVVASAKVYVQPVITRTADCFTDVSFSFHNEGNRTMCLKADDTDGEKRCFIIDVIDPNKDPCQPSLCKNNGRCLKQLYSTIYCICGEEYTGQFCEK